MSKNSSASIPYDQAGNPMWAADGAAIAGVTGVPIVGSDGTLARYLKVNTVGQQIVTLPDEGKGVDGRLRVGQESLILLDTFEGAAVNTITWVQSQSGMTQTVGSGAVTLNAASSLTSGNYSILSSFKNIRGLVEWGLYFQFRARFITRPNAVLEIGWGAAATTAAPTNGVFIRMPSTGALQAVINFGGTETVTELAAAGVVVSTTFYNVEVFVLEDRCRFEVSDAAGVLVAEAEVLLPATQCSPTTVATLPAFARVYNSALVTTPAAQLFICNVAVTQMDSGPVISETSSVTSVAASTSNVTLLAANVNRVAAMVFNDSNKILYLKLGVTASATSHTVQIAIGGYYELPLDANGKPWAGQIDGIWASGVAGSARITELM